MTKQELKEENEQLRIKTKELKARLDAAQSQNAQLQSRPDNTAKDKALLKSRGDLIQELANVMGCMPERDVLLKAVRKQKSDLRKAQDELSQARVHASEPAVNEAPQPEEAMVPVATIEAALEDNEFCQREYIKSKSLLERIGYLVTHANEYRELQGIILMMERDWAFDGDIIARAKDMAEAYEAQKGRIAEASSNAHKLIQRLGLSPSITFEEMCAHIDSMRERIDELASMDKWDELREALGKNKDASIASIIISTQRKIWAYQDIERLVRAGKSGHESTVFEIVRSAWKSHCRIEALDEQLIESERQCLELEEQLEDAAERVEKAFAMAGRALVTGG